jgi:uncharacterized protein involved in exopolysaccharide biosynthesis
MEYSVSDYIRLVYKRRNHFLIVVAMALIVATVLSLTFPPIYQSKLKMYTPTSMDILTFGGRSPGTQLRPLLPNLNELYSGAILGLLKSDQLKKMIFDTLAEERPRQLEYIIDYSPEYGHYEAIVNDRDRDRAYRIATLIPEKANELIVDISERALRNNIQYVSAQLDTAHIRLEEARAALREFREEHIHVVLGQQSAMIVSRNAEYQSEHDRLGIDLRKTEATIEELKRQMSDEARLFVENEAVAQDPTIQQLRASLTEREMRMAGLRTQYTQFHPAVTALQKEIDETRELIRREVERLFASRSKPANTFYESLRQSVIQEYVNLTATVARRDALSALIEESNQVLLSLPEIQNELANLMFEEKVRERVVEGLVSAKSELDLQVGRQFQSFIVLEAPKRPRSPSFPILWLNLLVSLLFGLAAGLFYCTLLEYYERAELMRYADQGAGPLPSGR